MKRTNDLTDRQKLSRKRRELRQLVDSGRQEIKWIRARPCFSLEDTQQAEAEAKRLEAEVNRLETDLRRTRRGSRSQLAAGWH